MVREQDPWPQICLGKFGQRKMKAAKVVATRGSRPVRDVGLMVSGMLFSTQSALSKYLVNESKRSHSLSDSFLCSTTHSFPPSECMWVGPMAVHLPWDAQCLSPVLAQQIFAE